MNPERGRVKEMARYAPHWEGRTLLRVAIYLALAPLLIGTVLHASNEQAHACMCEQSSTKEAIERADSVFLGMVVSIDRQEIKPRYDLGPEFEDVVEFSAIEVWKGEPSEKIFVRTTFNTGVENTCVYDGPSFYEGRKYLVFVKHGQARVHLCNYTREVQSLPEEWVLALGISKPLVPGSVSPIPERVGEPVPEPTVPAPVEVMQPTIEPATPVPVQNTQPSGSCGAPLGYAHGHADLAAFGLIAPLAWLAWRRRPGK